MKQSVWVSFVVGILALSNLASAQTSQGTFAYVANSGSNNVSAYTIDSTTGALIPVPGSPFAAGVKPVSVVMEPTGHFAYVLNAGLPPSFSANISAYSIDPTAGVLTPLPNSPVPILSGVGASSASIDPSGKFLYVILSASSFGAVAGFAIDANSGTLTPILGSPFASGSSLSPLTFHPSGKFAYMQRFATSNQGPKIILGFAVDSLTGALSPVPNSPFAGGSAGSSNGLFQMTVNPTGKFLLEPNIDSVSVFAIDSTTGSITEASGSPFSAPLAIQVAVHPTDRFAYVVDNSCGFPPDGFVTAFTIDSSSGALAKTSSIAAGTCPQSLTLHPSGLFAYAAGRVTVEGYSVDPATGLLTAVPNSPFQGGSLMETLTIDSTGSFLYTADAGSSNVFAYAINNENGALIPVSGSPFLAGASPQSVTIRQPALTPRPTGTISVSTNNAAATFTITDGGSNNFSGSGTSFVQIAPPGTYTITFGSVVDFSTPGPQTQTLSSGSAINFRGTYEPLVLSPSNLHATVGSGSVVLDWDASQTSNVDGYNVYIDQFIGNDFVALGTVNAVGAPFPSTHFVVSDQFSKGVITNGTLYRFHVTAVKSGVESPPSNLVLARPGQFALSQLPPPPKVPVLFLHGICLLSDDTDGPTYWKQTTDFLINDLHWTDGGALKYLPNEDPRTLFPELETFVSGASFYTATFGNCKANYDVGRSGILHQADEVHGFIAALNASGAAKIDIVAHSMGGLAARSYIADTPDAANSVMNFITYGSPHWGVQREIISNLINAVSDGAADLTVDCHLDPIGFTSTLDYSKSAFLEHLRQVSLPDGIRYVNLRGEFFLDAQHNFIDCLSLHWDTLISIDSADLVIPPKAPINQPLLIHKRTLITTNRSHPSEPSDFSAILCALDLNCLVYRTHSPVDIEITAPDGRMISRQLTEIPGASYMEIPEEIGSSATVLVPFPLGGKYSIKVVPKLGTATTDTYSLDVTRAGTTTILAQDQNIGAIPAQPYGVTVLPQLPIDIEPHRHGRIKIDEEQEQEGKIKVAIFSTSTFNAPARIDTNTLSFGHSGDERSLAFCKVSGKEAHGDGLRDLVCRFFTKKSGFIANDVIGILKGRTKDGVPFVSTGSVRIIFENRRETRRE